MTKRRLIVVLPALVLMPAALLLWWHWPRHRITEENVARIEKGMTLAEVEELLGAPPGEYDGCGCGATDSGILLSPISVWVSREAAVGVTIDEFGRVNVIRHGVPVTNEGTLEKLRRRLKL